MLLCDDSSFAILYQRGGKGFFLNNEIRNYP